LPKPTNDKSRLQRISYKTKKEYLFDSAIPPLVHVEQGESLVVETEDAMDGLIRSEDRLPIPEHVPNLQIAPPELNPVVGPIYIEGAKKGDVLAVTIEKIVVDSQGFTCFVPGIGPLNDSKKWSDCNGPYTHIIKHLPGKSGTTRDGKGVFNDKIVWDLQPFIGTIGVAPEREVESSLLTQGAWGGNMDCRDIKEGTTLLLNCYHDGGLLFVGDVHGSQADTEFYGIADESRAEVTLRCEVIKNKRLPNPRLVKQNSIVSLCSYRPLEDAVRTAMLDLMDWLVNEYGFDPREGYMHLCINPDLRVNIYQMVPVLRLAYTVGAEIPKKYLSMTPVSVK
jgi:acetamidase/formamidase